MRRFALLAALLVLPAASMVEEAVEAVGDARYVVIGERHDNPEHHRLQARIVAILQPAGLAFEMIPREDEALVNRLRAEGATREELAEALDWEARGWPSFDLYAPILEAAPDAYVAGGGLSKEQLGAIYADGAGAVDLPGGYGLGEPLPNDERDALLDEQYAAHCEMMPRDRLGAMVEVQRAWDAAYAEALRRAARRGGGRAVLIAGNQHARLDRGAPAALTRVEPDAVVVAIGLTEHGDGDPDAPFTAHVAAPPPEREDPCEQMRRAMEGKGG